MDTVPDDVVISGIGGSYPQCDNTEEFKNKLFENKYLVQPKWPENKERSNLVGCVESNYFDNSYFGIHRQQCFFMDPMHRLVLEATFQALLDAGVNPAEVRGQRIGVFIGSTIGENDQLFMESVVSGFGVTGHARAMLANRVSYWLNLKGPSVAYDANWISGIEVLRLAYYAIKTGQCDSVIVGTANLAQHEEFQVMYNDLGVLSLDGSTKAYDANGSGYARSEGVVAFYVQRASKARRHYASVVHAASRFDGTNPGGFLDVGTDQMVEFLEEFYKKSPVKPTEIDFIEGHGCGLKNIDKAELEALEKIYCKNRPSPVPVGSVKTVTGHAEPTAAMFSIVKTIVAMETGVVPATLQVEEPNPEIKPLRDGSIELVTTNKKMSINYAAVNALGTGAHFGHLILKANPKAKKPLKPVELPTLLIASTRTEEGIMKILETFKQKPKDPEYYKLVHDVFSKSIQGHLYRGYLLMGEEDTKQDIINHMGNKRPIWFVYSGMGSQWNGMLGDLMKIETFAESIGKCCKILEKKGIDLMRILSDQENGIFDNILNCFVGIAAMQIALTDVLTVLGIVPDGIIGHSVGELGCAYADGCMTAEQMILSSYSRGRASVEATLIQGMMAAIGLGYNQIKDRLPPTIEVACRNGSDSCTISGPAEDMERFVESLQSQGVFAKLVNVANIAYHSRYIKPAAPLLLKYLKEILTKPMPRSSKWISTSNAESNWDSDLARHSSAEYHTNNLLSAVLFEEGTKHIPKDSVLIEIAPHGLLQAILKRSVKECTSIPLTKRGAKSSAEFLLNSLGKMYLAGLDMQLANIYPKIEYPVSRNTPSLSDLVHWNHSETWSRTDDAQKNVMGVRNVDINVNSDEFVHCLNHKIHDQAILPITSYLDIIMNITDDAFTGYGVVLENIHVKKNLALPKIGFVPLYAMMQHGSGEFEIFSGSELVMKGRITVVEEKADMGELESLDIPVNDKSVQLSQGDVYTEFGHRGYQLEDRYKGIKGMILSQKGSKTAVKWTKRWQDLVESMIQQQLFVSGERNQEVCMPRYIQKISIVFGALPTSDDADANVDFEYATKTISAPGVEIFDLRTAPCNKKELEVKLDSFNMIALEDAESKNIQSVIEQTIQLAISNFKGSATDKIFVTELETLNSLQDDIKTFIATNKTNINYTCIKEKKQMILVEKYPQLFVYNDFVTPDVLSILSNSSTLFMITKAKMDQKFDSKVSVVARFRSGQDHYAIFKKAVSTKPNVIHINDTPVTLKDIEKKATWVKELVNNTKQDPNQPTLLVSPNVPVEGFLNFLKGVRALTSTQNISVFYNLDQNPSSLGTAIEKDLSLSILKDGRWYSYVPLTLKLDETGEMKASRVPIIENKQISYISLNLKDETVTPELKNRNEIGNIDYSGVTKTGQRVMGLAYLDKENSKLVVDDVLTWEVPQDFTLDDAVTIPHAYVSAYYMLIVKARLKHGEPVLIHAGCSPIGLAAMSIAYSYGCEIFTTVSTVRQKVFLQKQYVFLKPKNILFAADASFEAEVMTATAGTGVKVVLNCLSGNLLKCSFNCMAEFGRFIQYCKYDVEEGTTVGMSVFLRNVDFCHVDLQNVFHQDGDLKKELRDLIQEGFKKFVVRPLKKEIINHHNISQIMRKLESPDTIGKLIISAVNNFNVNKLNVNEPHRFACGSKYTYLIYGGSADNWLHVAEWLVHRGAKKIIISSDGRLVENHLQRRLSILENYYGADLITASHNGPSESNAHQLLAEVVNLGDIHVTFILSDENSVVQYFDEALRKVAPKATLVNITKSSNAVCYKRAMSGYSGINIEMPDQEDIQRVVASLDIVLSSDSNDVVIERYRSDDSSVNSSKAVINDISKLIPKIDDIIQRQKNAPSEPDLLQVVTEGPAEIRELIPVFIIPGLAGNKELEIFTRNLLYPTFYAVYPSAPWPLEKLAEVFAQKMSEVYRKEIYNIVSTSSGGPLAILIAKQLAKRNATLTLFFIDSAPVRIQQGFKNLLGDDGVEFEVDLLRMAFKINDMEIIQPLKSCASFEDRVKLLVGRVEKTDKEKSLIEKGLLVVKDFIDRVKSFEWREEAIAAGQIHVLVPEDCSIFDYYGMTSYFKSLPTVTKMAGDHISIIKNPDTQEYVNNHHYQIY
ncbi:unnamed protein product [Phyllotreta striolata]|uniref:Uncharacterized protein n=1 Tax=Phyllotreta striolata TaxID=444603 RepID=A0A9N9TL20_PHYSR|nr:unnamed protein product [Phyllotreta striolata]